MYENHRTQFCKLYPFLLPVTSYVCMLSVWSINTIFTNMVVMDVSIGYATSLLIVINSFYCYRSCLNIYIRFKLRDKSSALPWEESEDLPWVDEYPRPTTSSSYDYNMSNIALHCNKAKTRKRSMLSFLHKRRKSFTDPEYRTSEERAKTHRNVIQHLYDSGPPDMHGISIEGYVTVDNNSCKHRRRRYLVVHGTEMFFYKNKRLFDLNPTQMLRARPLDLTLYSLVVKLSFFILSFPPLRHPLVFILYFAHTLFSLYIYIHPRISHTNTQNSYAHA